MALYRVNDKPQRTVGDDDYYHYYDVGDYVTVKDITDVDYDGEVQVTGGGYLRYILPSALDRVDVVEDFEGVEPQKPMATTEREALAMARANYGYVLWYRQQREQDPQVQAIADATGKDYAEAKALYDAGLRLMGSEPFQVGDYVTVNPRPDGSTYGISVNKFPFSGRITEKGYDVPGDEASTYYLVGDWLVTADMMTKEEN